VIHADLPNDRETLLHRSGRTGRAGRKGVCVLLVPYTRRRKAEGLLAQAGVDAEWGPPPTVDAIRAGDQERLSQELASQDDIGEDDVAMARALLADRSPEEIATALVRLYRSGCPPPRISWMPARRRGRAARTGPIARRASPAPARIATTAPWRGSA
jgi:ATP-dependent RNA helicase DeaD